MKIRIRFAKYGMMKFIGHLDMMRYFQKAMRRADIDIAYSEGFSPHQIMSFAAPLGVGVTSEGEYLDIEVHSTRSSEEALRALNEAMVEGVSVLEYRRLPEGAKNAMSSVAAADYTVAFKDKEDNPFTLKELSEAVHGFYQEQAEILITKQTKKSEKMMDLKPLIYALTAIPCPETEDGDTSSDTENPGFFMKVCTGSSDNVKPELVLSAFADYCREHSICRFEYQPAKMQIHRLEVYAASEDDFLPLGALGCDIV